MAGKFDWRVLLSGLSSALPALQRNRANDRAQEDIASGQAAIGARQHEADELIGNEVTKLASSGPGADRQASLAQYSQALQRARAAPGASTAPNLGGAAFQADTKSAAADTAQYGSRQSGQLATIDAASRQREREGQGFARAASDVGNLGRQASTEEYIARLAASRRRVSPWAELISKLGQQIANHYEPTDPVDPLQEIDIGAISRKRLPRPRAIPPLAKMPGG